MREFDRVKAALMGDGHLPVDGQPTFVVVKRQILEPEGSVMPLNAGAIQKGEGLEADSAPDELRAVADCLESGAGGHAERLRVIADALESAPDGPEGSK
jgi:hypothetical protein